MSAFWRRKVRLAGHVGAGHQPQALAVAEVAIVGDERAAAAALQRRLDHRMAAARDAEHAVADHARARPALGLGEIGEAGGDVDQRQRAGGLGDAVGARGHFADEVGEQAQLQRHRLVGGLRDLGLQLAQLDGGEARGVGGRSGAG